MINGRQKKIHAKHFALEFDFESRLYTTIEKHVLVFCAIALVGLGMLLRWSGRHFTSMDYILFLDGWYHQIGEGGIASLGAQVGNYNIPYQVVIALLTYLPCSARAAYKIVSIAFDVSLAVASGMLVYRIRGNESPGLSILAGSIVFTLPTVVLNSGWWAQCDSIYVSFCIFSLVCFLDEKYVACFLLYGCALAFKLQAIFLMPFWILALVRTRRFSVCYFLLIPISMILLSLPGLLAGRHLLDIVKMYVTQVNQSSRMYWNYPSFWALFVPDDYGYVSLFKQFSVGLTVSVIGVIVALFIKMRISLRSPHNTVYVALVLVYTAVFFLPAMHERYAYLVEVLLVVAAFGSARYIAPAVVAEMIAMKLYLSYLCSDGVVNLNPPATSISVLAVVNLVTYAIIVAVLFRTLYERENVLPLARTVIGKDNDSLMQSAQD